ncbi:TPA: ATP-binding protein [Citrobacter koseri]|nr:ATP-binding protein [Citrobacter koseri]
MIFTRLRFINLYAFADAELNLSYPRKPVNMPLDGEFLFSRPKFYYKKVCVITGGNASGKTSLGRVLCGIQLFLRTKELRQSLRINDKTKDASFEVDFATEDCNHHRLYVRFAPNDEGTYVVKEINYGSVRIALNDSCFKTTEKLNLLFSGKPPSSSEVYFHELDENGETVILEQFKKYKFFGGWYYLLSETKESTAGISGVNKNLLERIIRTFDSSIIGVSEMQEPKAEGKDDEPASVFLIRFKNSDSLVVTSKGEITNSDRLSRGTFDAVTLSHFISAIISDHEALKHGELIPSMTYFLDEKLAFTHSELERMIVALIISKLKENTQFFYTTHNMDIFELDLPVHSFIFIRKTEDNSEFVEASSVLKKNDRSMRSAVERDIFGVLPDTSLVSELL